MAIRLTRNVERPDALTLILNGETVSAYAGETVATLLFAEDIHVFYKTDDAQGHAPFCNMGTCFECLVYVKRRHCSDSPAWVRACMTEVEQDMLIETGHQINSKHNSHENG